MQEARERQNHQPREPVTGRSQGASRSPLPNAKQPPKVRSIELGSIEGPWWANANRSRPEMRESLLDFAAEKAIEGCRRGACPPHFPRLPALLCGIGRPGSTMRMAECQWWAYSAAIVVLSLELC